MESVAEGQPDDGCGSFNLGAMGDGSLDKSRDSGSPARSPRGHLPIHSLAEDASVSEVALKWLTAENIHTLDDLANCAPSEEAFWATVVTPMQLPDLGARARIVTMWKQARKLTFDQQPQIPDVTIGKAKHRAMVRDRKREQPQVHFEDSSKLDQKRDPQKRMQTIRNFQNFAFRTHGGRKVTERDFWNKIIRAKSTSNLSAIESQPLPPRQESDDLAENSSSLSAFAEKSSSLGERLVFKPTQEVSSLRAFCDLTSERVAGVFERCDENKDGFLSKDEIKTAFGCLGMREYSRNVLQLMEQMMEGNRDRSEKKMMDIYEFDVMFERLRLAELFNPATQLFKKCNPGDENPANRHGNVIVCCDYSCDDLKLSLVTSEAESSSIEKFWQALPRLDRLFWQKLYNHHNTEYDGMPRKMGITEYGDFFFEARPTFSKKVEALSPSSSRSSLHGKLKLEGAQAARWVHVDALGGADRLTLFRLGVKYHLHPLAMDDLLNNKDETRMEVYDDSYVISCSVLMLPKSDDPNGKDHDPKGKEPPPRVRIHRSHATVFLATAGPGNHDNCAPDADGEMHPAGCAPKVAFDTLVSVHHDQPCDSSWISYWKSDKKSNSETPERSVWQELLDAVHSDPPHRLREGGVDWLIYEMMSKIVQAMEPIAAAYAQRIGFMRRTDMRDFKKEWLDELGDVQLELSEIARQVKPLKRVVNKMINGPHLKDLVKLHLADVQDSIDCIIEDTIQLTQMCDLLANQHSSYGEKQANDTLFLISILTALFMPLQFVTGIYGMNFVDEHGRPGIPELTWEFGYAYFWTLMVVLFCISLSIFGLWTGRKNLRNRLVKFYNRLRNMMKERWVSEDTICGCLPRSFAPQVSYQRMDQSASLIVNRRTEY